MSWAVFVTSWNVGVDEKIKVITQPDIKYFEKWFPDFQKKGMENVVLRDSFNSWLS